MAGKAQNRQSATRRRHVPDNPLEPVSIPNECTKIDGEAEKGTPPSVMIQVSLCNMEFPCKHALACKVVSCARKHLGRRGADPQERCCTGSHHWTKHPCGQDQGRVGLPGHLHDSAAAPCATTPMRFAPMHGSYLLAPCWLLSYSHHMQSSCHCHVMVRAPQACSSDSNKPAAAKMRWQLYGVLAFGTTGTLSS